MKDEVEDTTPMYRDYEDLERHALTAISSILLETSLNVGGVEMAYTRIANVVRALSIGVNMRGIEKGRRIGGVSVVEKISRYLEAEKNITEIRIESTFAPAKKIGSSLSVKNSTGKHSRVVSRKLFVYALIIWAIFLTFVVVCVGACLEIVDIPIYTTNGRLQISSQDSHRYLDVYRGSGN